VALPPVIDPPLWALAEEPEPASAIIATMMTSTNFTSTSWFGVSLDNQERPELCQRSAVQAKRLNDQFLGNHLGARRGLAVALKLAKINEKQCGK
jgi:hypothetical protein